MPYSRIQRFLNVSATRIWKQVTAARENPIFPFIEVGVTERLHLDMLMRGFHGGLGGLRWTDTKELVTGADWEWVICDPAGANRVLWYRMQAKILKRQPYGTPNPTLRFEEINHRNRQQRRDLLTNEPRAYPFYCFYIGDPWPASDPVQYPPGVLSPSHQKQHGATAVPAQVVDNVSNATTIAQTRANQYLTAGTGTSLRNGVGRRLSDLFPSGATAGGATAGGATAGGATAGGATAGGATAGGGGLVFDPGGPDGPTVDWVDVTDLPEQMQEDIAAIRATPAGTTFIERSVWRDNAPRVTAYFVPTSQRPVV